MKKLTPDQIQLASNWTLLWAVGAVIIQLFPVLDGYTLLCSAAWGWLCGYTGVIAILGAGR